MNGVVSPEFFGAAGNGINDDTAALQTAINTGKRVILGENKTYLIRKPLSPPSHLYILGGVNSVIKWGNPIMDNMLYIRSNVVIEGVVFDGNLRNTIDSETEGKTKSLLYCGTKNSNITISDCTFKNATGSGIILYTVSDVHIQNNTFDGLGWDAIALLNDLNNIHVGENRISNAYGIGIKIGSNLSQPSKSIFVQDNVIENLTTKVEANYSMGIEVHNYVSDVDVSKNIIKNVPDMGISISNVKVCTVDGNKISNVGTVGTPTSLAYGTGLEIVGSNEVKATENEIFDCSQQCIIIDKSTNVTIGNSTIENYVRTDYSNECFGIKVSGSPALNNEFVSILGNKIKGGTYGIRSDHFMTNLDIKNNQLDQCFSPVKLGNISNVTIGSNHISNHINTGVYINGVTNLMAYDNMMTTGAIGSSHFSIGSNSTSIVIQGNFTKGQRNGVSMVANTSGVNNLTIWNNTFNDAIVPIADKEAIMRFPNSHIKSNIENSILQV